MNKAIHVKGYMDKRQVREKLQFETYQYSMPFNYDNIHVFRKFVHGSEFQGVELETACPSSPSIRIERCPKNEWFEAKTTFEVPPMAVKVRFEMGAGGQREGETVFFDDVFSCVLPDGWGKGDAAPRGAKNQLKNASFEKIDKKTNFASGWRNFKRGTGEFKITDKSAHSGKRSITAKVVEEISLWQDIAVKEGQQLYWSIWIKSSTHEPRNSIYLRPVFYDRYGGLVSDNAGDCIVVEEDKPIVRVVVIGSACTPPGYVQVECEVIDSWRRHEEVRGVMPVRFRINNLWGMHLRVGQWLMRSKEIKRFEGDTSYEEIPKGLIEIHPGLKRMGVKSDSYEFPLTGMSSSIFEIPPSRKIVIRGGSEVPGWCSDQAPDDGHYAFRMIRTTVMK